MINYFYCQYHFFIIEYIFGYRLGLIGAVVIFFLGLLLDKIKRKCGFIAAVLLHMGVDFGVVMVFADVVFKAVGNIGRMTPAIFRPDSIPLDFLMIDMGV